MHSSPSLRLATGLVALGGCVTGALANVWASLAVEGHDWVADTISDLAAGPHEVIMDMGLYAYTTGIAAALAGASNLHPGGWRWTLGLVAFLALVPIVVLVGAHEAYSEQAEGAVIHSMLVYAMGVLFALGPLSMAQGAGRIGAGWRRVFLGAGLVWLVLAPVFLVSPTSIDGALERLLGAVTFLWIGGTGLMLLGSARYGGDAASA